MLQQINRIRLKRLWCEGDLFDPIIFHDGVNLIVGEKYDESSRKGRKTNGVGKSICVSMIDFCLLSDYTKSRCSHIPDQTFPKTTYVFLDLTIGDVELTIKRNFAEHRRVHIIKDGVTATYSLDDAKAIVSGYIFQDLDGAPSLRSFLSLLIRDEASEFQNFLDPHSASVKAGVDYAPHLYFLGISLTDYYSLVEMVKKSKELENTIKKIHKMLIQNGKISDIRKRVNALEDELKIIDEAVDEFKTNEAFASMEKDILHLEEQIEELRIKQTALLREAEKIEMLPALEIESDDLRLVYDQFRKECGEALVKSLEEVLEFRKKIEDFQKALLTDRRTQIHDELNRIRVAIGLLDEEYAKKMKIIDQKGVLKNLKNGLRIYEQKKSEYATMIQQLKQWERLKNEHDDMQYEIIDLFKSLQQQTRSLDYLVDSLQRSILAIHEQIMGNRSCAFYLTLCDAGKKIKNPVIDLTLRINDDGSSSINRSRVFIYDLALMTNEYTYLRHPHLLIHDNIFNVDQDTLVQSLAYLDVLESLVPDFQYILTINRDKIEGEERRRLITMDIDAHKVATFTKDRKFLRQAYQEK